MIEKFMARKGVRSVFSSYSIHINKQTFKAVNHFYWPTNALNCIKLKG